MIYLNSTNLPKVLRDETGYNLCIYWFLTLYEICDATNMKDLNKKFTDYKSKLNIEEVSKYKVGITSEILCIKGKYVVGNGLGKIIYNPFRVDKDISDYESGKLPIENKFSVIRGRNA